MSPTGFRGLQEKHEHGAQEVARDTRPLGVRLAEFLSEPLHAAVLFGGNIGLMAFYPYFADIFFILALGLFIFITTRTPRLPFRMPRSSGSVDFNDLIPGTAKPKKAGGISFFGNDRVTGEELWFNNDDLRTHVLIFGSTGSGKTEALVSIAFNSLIHGSGFIYVDGKGDNSLFAKVFSMVRRMGREDDMLLINFMTGARDIIGPQESRLSNTMNPFASGSSSMVAQLVTSLMDSSSQGQGGDMWKGRAINFVESLMKILCAMRDAGHILLDANSIREYFILEKLESMVVDKKFPVNENYSVDIGSMPKEVLEPLKNYVLNLPGYNPKKKGDQAGEVREQHGFITMQLTRVFGSLADTYGHIMRTNLAEVDLKDVVLNRRILVVLLPALEKAPDELANLGKIIIASLKAMMAAGLGDSVEGNYRDVILRKPTTSPSPYVCIMDEYGYYAVQGFAVVPAQARSLGFSAIFAGQDLPAFQKASKEEAASIGANCNIKICMKLEDPQETWDFFNKVAGETYTTSVSGFQVGNSSVSMNYMDTKNASVDKKQRIDLLDLKDQREGEAHVFFKSKIVRAEMFYANPKPVDRMRLNHFLKVETPNEEELKNLDKRLRRFGEIFTQEKIQIPVCTSTREIDIIVASLQKNAALKPAERGLMALISLLEEEVDHQKQINAPFEAEYREEQKASIFTRIKVEPITAALIGDDQAIFSLPLLRRGSTLEELQNLEHLSGSALNVAQGNANSIVRDLENATSYPPEILFLRDREQLLKDLNQLIQLLGGTPVQAETAPVSSQPLSSEPTPVATKNSMATEAASLPDLPNLDDSFEEDTEEDTGDESGGSGDTGGILDVPEDGNIEGELPTLEEFEALLRSHGINLDDLEDKD
jgi:intracellular multiplication protein IcmO